MDQPVGNGPGLGQLVGAKQDGELVAAEAGRDVRAAQLPAQGVGNLTEQAVPSGVPVHIIHGLEAVEVDEQDSRRAFPQPPLQQSQEGWSV
jgi:hypothetical protein